MYGFRCDERLETKVEESTRLEFGEAFVILNGVTNNFPSHELKKAAAEMLVFPIRTMHIVRLILAFVSISSRFHHLLLFYSPALCVQMGTCVLCLSHTFVHLTTDRRRRSWPSVLLPLRCPYLLCAQVSALRSVSFSSVLQR
jgi:hypothetical protein